MCGLAGELNFKGVCDTSALQKMLENTRYRGPDHADIFVDGAIGFAHSRLAIIDLSTAANQPMQDNELKLTLVFNGVIYNYRQLRDELCTAGYHFFSHSDTEVIIKAYHHWGEECVSQLKGVFAFAIWDKVHSRLFLARDRFGIKPLYYAKTDKAFRFASSLPALLATGEINTAIDAVALHHHLSLHAVVPAPLTLLKGVRKVRPAHSMTITASGEIKENRYWQLKAKAGGQHSEEAWIQGLEEELLQAVKLRYEVADVPTGVLLSGGLDSSLIVALLRKAGVNNLNTYSIGFESEGEECGNEFKYSELVAQRYETRHHRFDVTNTSLLECLPEVIPYMAEPMAGQDCVAFFLLAQQLSQNIKVVQTGQGADEVFGGYFWYPLMRDSTAATDIERFRQHYFDCTHAEFQESIASEYDVGDTTSWLIASLLEENKMDDFVNTVLSMDVTTLIVDDPVKRVDNMTMAWGVEARVPFLDCSLVEFTAGMPADLKLRAGGKYLLKQLARQLLPVEVIERPKAYFPVPALHYVRGPFYQMAEAVLNSKACVERGLFKRPYIRKLLANPNEYKTPIRGNRLWHYTVLEMWLQHHIDGGGTGSCKEYGHTF